jgi:hypothetical protein
MANTRPSVDKLWFINLPSVWIFALEGTCRPIVVLFGLTWPLSGVLSLLKDLFCTTWAAFSLSYSAYGFSRLSEPARSTMFRSDSRGLPSFVVVFILIWKMWWLLELWSFCPLSLKMRLWEESLIWFKNCWMKLDLSPLVWESYIQVCPTRLVPYKLNILPTSACVCFDDLPNFWTFWTFESSRRSFIYSQYISMAETSI